MTCTFPYKEKGNFLCHQAIFRHLFLLFYRIYFLRDNSNFFHPNRELDGCCKLVYLNSLFCILIKNLKEKNKI